MDVRFWVVIIIAAGMLLTAAGVFAATRRKSHSAGPMTGTESGEACPMTGAAPSEVLPVTGIAEIDRLFYQKDCLCAEKGIACTWRIGDIPADILSRRDLVSLAGNLLDNAIEAAEKSDRWIRTEARVKRGQWILIVENSKLREETPLASGMETTKEDRVNHGLGTGIIDSIIASADGYVKRRDEEDRFRVFVAIPIPIK